MNSQLPAAGAPGGDPLAGLRAYRLPDPVGWWPPAPGWWLLVALLLIVAVLAAIWIVRRRRCRAAARAAQHELARLRRRLTHTRDGAGFVRELSKLLRRYVLAVFPRRDVAALTGEDWLAFLDAHGGGGRFTHGPGRWLVEAPYRAAAEVPGDQLAVLIGDWIRDNPDSCR